MQYWEQQGEGAEELQKVNIWQICLMILYICDMFLSSRAPYHKSAMEFFAKVIDC